MAKIFNEIDHVWIIVILYVVVTFVSGVFHIVWLEKHSEAFQTALLTALVFGKRGEAK